MAEPVFAQRAKLLCAAVSSFVVSLLSLVERARNVVSVSSQSCLPIARSKVRVGGTSFSSAGKKTQCFRRRRSRPQAQKLLVEQPQRRKEDADDRESTRHRKETNSPLHQLPAHSPLQQPPAQRTLREAA